MNFKKLLSLITAFTIMLTLGSVVFAQNDNKKMSDKDWQKRREALEKKMEELGSNPDELKKFYEKNGLVQSEIIEAIQPMSSPGSVSLYSIGGFYDQYSGRYLVEGYWTWNTTPDLSSGAMDGVSLVMCNTDYTACNGFIYDSDPAGITVYDTNGNSYDTAGGASTIDRSGIIWNFQDQWVNTASYVGYRGHVWFWMIDPPTTYPFYIKMDMQHTWSNATFTGAGFNWTPGQAPQINLSFSTTPSQFKKANQITLSSWPPLY